MANLSVDPVLTPSGQAQGEGGLRAYLSHVYLKVSAGLVVSAAIAWCIANLPAVRGIFFVVQDGLIGLTLWGLLLAFSPLVVILIAGFALRDRFAQGSGVLYWTVAALIGASLSVLFLVYAGAELALTFLVTAGAFAGLSAWGYMTRQNLSGLGNFLVVALFGLILAMVVNLFVKSAAADLVINIVGVLVFSGLIAVDTQRLKDYYYQAANDEELEASSNYGALTLYLNFINLFQFLLSMTGLRSRR